MSPADVRKAAGKYGIIRMKVTATGTVSAEGDKLTLEIPGSKLSLPVVAQSAEGKKEKEAAAKAIADLKKAAAKKGSSFTITGEANEDGSIGLVSCAPAKK